MADFRQIHTSIWDDDWFCQLSSDAKVVFVWLFSNRRASVSGLYKFTEFICSRETGITIENVHVAIEKLSSDNKIRVEGEWVWVKNLRKYNYYQNGNADKRILADLSQLPNNGLKKAYVAYYKPLASPSIAPTTPLLEQEQEREQEKEKENKEENGDFSKIQRQIESLIGYPPGGKSGLDAIDKIIKLGATEEDIKTGYEWLRDNSNKPVKYYSSLVGPIQTAIARRTQKPKADVGLNPYEGAKRYE